MNNANLTFTNGMRGVLTRSQNYQRSIFLPEESADQNYFQIIPEIVCFLVLIICVFIIIYGIKQVHDLISDDQTNEKDGTQSRRITQCRVSLKHN